MNLISAHVQYRSHNSARPTARSHTAPLSPARSCTSRFELPASCAGEHHPSRHGRVPERLTYLTVSEGGVYFANGVGILLSDLYRTDGTAAGTHQLTLPAITGTLGFIYAMQSTADGLYVRITETLASEPILLVQRDQVSTVCTGLQVPYGSAAPWLKTLAGGVLTTGAR